MVWCLVPCWRYFGSIRVFQAMSFSVACGRYLDTCVVILAACASDEFSRPASLLLKIPVDGSRVPEYLDILVVGTLVC